MNTDQTEVHSELERTPFLEQLEHLLNNKIEQHKIEEICLLDVDHTVCGFEFPESPEQTERIEALTKQFPGNLTDTDKEELLKIANSLNFALLDHIKAQKPTHQKHAYVMFFTDMMLKKSDIWHRNLLKMLLEWEGIKVLEVLTPHDTFRNKIYHNHTETLYKRLINPEGARQRRFDPEEFRKTLESELNSESESNAEIKELLVSISAFTRENYKENLPGSAFKSCQEGVSYIKESNLGKALLDWWTLKTFDPIYENPENQAAETIAKKDIHPKAIMFEHFMHHLKNNKNFASRFHKNVKIRIADDNKNALRSIHLLTQHNPSYERENIQLLIINPQDGSFGKSFNLTENFPSDNAVHVTGNKKNRFNKVYSVSSSVGNFFWSKLQIVPGEAGTVKQKTTSRSEGFEPVNNTFPSRSTGKKNKSKVKKFFTRSQPASRAASRAASPVQGQEGKISITPPSSDSGLSPSQSPEESPRDKPFTRGSNTLYRTTTN